MNQVIEPVRKQLEAVRDEASVLLSGLPSSKEDALARIDKMGEALMESRDILRLSSLESMRVAGGTTQAQVADQAADQVKEAVMEADKTDPEPAA